LCYAKDKTKLKSFTEVESTDWAQTNADDDPRGNWFSGSVSFTEKRSNPKHKNYYSITSPSGIVWTRQWQKSREEMDRLLAENRIYFGPAPEYNSVPRIKIFNGEQTEVIPRNIIDCVESTRKAQRHLDKLLGVKGLFDNPKPVELISHLIEITQMKADALVMDFFAGSGTTFDAVAKMNAADGGTRRCILVQSGEVVETNNQFRTIFDICKRRCELVAEKYDQELVVWELVMKAAPSVECLRSSSEA
jgi:adenine-specific DNA-methyltransferase